MTQDPSRLSRLTAILIQLQTRQLITAPMLAEKFGVSIRTIYRDIRALEESGVPVLTEEGKGYTLMEGYRVPPVMFTESEAHALITAQQLVQKNKDASFVREFASAVDKIKSVLRYSTKAQANLLGERMAINGNNNLDRSSDHLSRLQLALTHYKVVRVNYQKADAETPEQRMLEPFALLSTQENWLLVAWCRLRRSFRLFRLDRIRQLELLDEVFEPHNMTLQEYFEKAQKNNWEPLDKR